MAEEWKPVVGYEAYYEVSSGGRVRSVRRGRILRGYVTRKGFVAVSLCVPGRGYSTKQVQRLVAEAFVGPVPRGHSVYHKNRNRTDNSLPNLVVATQAEWYRLAAQMGLTTQAFGAGEKNILAKLTAEQVRELRRLRGRGLSYPKLAAHFRVSVATAYRAANGERHWRCVEPEPSCSAA
jgi:hypothetical protein